MYDLLLKLVLWFYVSLEPTQVALVIETDVLACWSAQQLQPLHEDAAKETTWRFSRSFSAGSKSKQMKIFPLEVGSPRKRSTLARFETFHYKFSTGNIIPRRK